MSSTYTTPSGAWSLPTCTSDNTTPVTCLRVDHIELADGDAAPVMSEQCKSAGLESLHLDAMMIWSTT